MHDVKGIASTVTSGAGAVSAWLATFSEIVQIIASIVAITAGCFSIYHYIKKGKE